MQRRQPEKGKAPAGGTTEASIEVTQDANQGNIMLNSKAVQASSQPCASTFNFEGDDVRVITIDGNPWFVAADLCRALHLTNSRVALKALAEDEKGVSSIYTPGGVQQVAVVNEAGMWTLVLRCRDAVTEGTVPYRMRRWVAHEVLPTLRKSGIYVNNPQDSELLKSAFSLATEVAASALRTVFDAVIEGKDVSKWDRWMFCLNHDRDGKATVPWAKPIQSDAMVVSMKELPKRLAEPNGMMPSDEELANLAAACAMRLSARAASRMGMSNGRMATS